MKYILCAITVIAFFAGCTFNVKEESKEITLTSSSAGLTQISIKENLLEEDDIDIQGIEEKSIIVTAVARMLVLSDNDDDLDNLQLSIGSGGEIGYAYPGDGWSRITIDEMSVSMDKTLNCDLKSVSGDITIADMVGVCKIETISGDCIVETIKGCDIKTTSGDIDVSVGYDSLIDTTDLFIETVSGDVGINLDPYVPAFTNVVYYISVETTSGDVIITVPKGFTADLGYNTNSGNKSISSAFIDYDGAKHSIICSTTSGDLTIHTYSH